VDLGPVREIRDKIADKSLQKIGFSDLWHLFRPGDVVMSENHEREQLCTVYSLNADDPIRFKSRRAVQITRPRYRRETDLEDINDEVPYAQEDDEYPPFLLRCYYTVCDGVLVGPACRDVVILYFSGEKPIFDLPAYPVSLHPDEATILRRFRDRGVRFLSSQGHKHYEGVTVTPDQCREMPLNEEVHGEVYVDTKTGYRMTGFRDRPYMMKPEPDIVEPRREIIERRGIIERREIIQRREIDFWGSDVDLLANRTLLLARVQNHIIDRKRGNDFVGSHASSFRIISMEKALEALEYLQLLPHQLLTFVFRLRLWSTISSYLLRLDGYYPSC